MGQVDGFLKFNRELPDSRDPETRIEDYKEIYQEFDDNRTVEQAARCMDCGVPFCHTGCPLGNNIPEFNDAVYEENWDYAIQILSTTNNFPEFTGRICPAPCEASCVLGINKPPVAIEHIEKTIAEKAFELGYIKPHKPTERSGKSVAVVGSGPAGLAAAAQLNKSGHLVTVFERDDRLGGLLRYGIPDFKLEKWVVERRIKIMEKEGITFKTNANIGVNVDVRELIEEFDAIVLCGGATLPRDLPIAGREFKGIYFAMEFLTQQNKRVSGDEIDGSTSISAEGKHVVVIGGGDTGSDCIGTSNRHGAASITQLEIMPKPPHARAEDNPWPQWPLILRTSSSHEEGSDRSWSVLTKSFKGDDQGNVKSIELIDVEWVREGSGMKFKEIPGTEREIPADLILLAIGFTGPEQEGMLKRMGVGIDRRGNVDAPKYHTNIDGIFTAGDMRRGQSLVVWAIAEGREAAKEVDQYLSISSNLEARDHSRLEIH
ncbi:MAG: glutamate synthase subunit beta [Bacteroidota bacterium]